MAEKGAIRGVICDMDGTLVHESLDFELIRQEIGLPARMPILEAIAAMPDEPRRRAEAILTAHERAAAASTVVLPGVVTFLAKLDELNVRRAVLTRNSNVNARTILERCQLIGFDPVFAREDAPFKPDPGGILAICERWQLQPSEVLMLGDYIFDVEAGERAGARTALITHGRHWHFAHRADFLISNYDSIPEQLWTLMKSK